MYNPITAYRIQFNKDFTFSQLENILPYLVQLGVKTLYASPIFAATPGSSHGYDITNPVEVNPELGSREQLENICRQLKESGIGWMQDIVPNHMAWHEQNARLMDVLKNGQQSGYSSWFDIDWDHPICKGKVLAPLLSAPLDAVLREGHIQIEKADGQLVLKIENTTLPLSSASYPALPDGTEWTSEINEWTDAINSDTDKMKALLAQQHYRLCPWQTTETTINYRRFFTVNALIGLNIDEILPEHHALITSFAERELFSGVRIDHIDGLNQPTTYLHQIRQLLGDDMYISVEKILQPDEDLPNYWPVQGTTGYDFIALINGLFRMNSSTAVLQNFYNQISENTLSFRQQLQEKKKLILNDYMRGELDNLTRMLSNLAMETGIQVTDTLLSRTMEAFLAACPVYRLYSEQLPMDVAESTLTRNILQQIETAQPELKPGILLLKEVLLLQPYEREEQYRAMAARFFRQCMQLTGPLMAKGLEDTLMYTYNRFIAHNEVGDSPNEPGRTVAEFHRQVLHRAKNWPLTMNATATHDTKRGEDARARLHVLGDRAEQWQLTVNQWHELNAIHRTNNAPTFNDEYFIYQSLVACYPMPGQDAGDFAERFLAYMQKALREAKEHTSWTEADNTYEQYVAGFVTTIMAQESVFMESFRQFMAGIYDAGIVNSLVQLILKCTCPGIPDLYQGCELWDLSMVDPDNRRPVDYGLRSQWLNELATATANTSELWTDRYNGKIKLWLLHELLELRNQNVALYTEGEYLPLQITGAYAAHIVAYARRHSGCWHLIVLPLNIAALPGAVTDIDWMDTVVQLLPGMPTKYNHTIQKSLATFENQIPVREIFSTLPVAVLTAAVRENKRSAGVLLPVFSLPSQFGIGDFGNDARRFANLLHRSGQRYWQLLPLNPTDSGNLYSPYSSQSGMACNTLLISPEMLINDLLLEPSEVEQYKLPAGEKIYYATVELNKRALMEAAYARYKRNNYTSLNHAFRQFCNRQAHWLNDHALYMALKNYHGDSPWFRWPAPAKKRNKQYLLQFEKVHASEIEQIKWNQFIADRQWQAVRQYCKSKQVKLFGDLPFYVSYDSVDVWANPEYFSVDDNGLMTGVAGVPPDYFSADGQHWGVPTYNWEKISADNYQWWAARLKRNLDFFDVVRIDHFRALATYWQIPAGETTARNGSWLNGPGLEFFRAMEQQLGKLPFIAEDLGYEMEDVYRLREECGLPGMKVLQFAWGNNMSKSVDIPHNFPTNCVVYTGTHDNNTTRGWYEAETDKLMRQQICEYAGCTADADNIHEVLARMAYASVAEMAILPYQDLTGLAAAHRMNTPGTITGNWQWRMKGYPDKEIEDYLMLLAKTYNRI